MKNKERFKEQLVTACKQNTFSAFFDQYIRPYYQCRSFGEWDFMSYYKIAILTMLWLDEEYQELEMGWSNVKTDDPILVSMDGHYWYHRHFAEYRDGIVCAFDGGATSWTTKLKTEWPYAKLAEPHKTEHDGCVGCKYEHFEAAQEPCKDCQYAYIDQYEPKEEIK